MAEAIEDAALLTWIARTGQGDRTAFTQLYTATSATLLAVALRLLRDRARAEDALQDAFVQIWHKASEYHAGRGPVLGWMVSIVRYRAIDQLRREGRIRADDSGAELADESLVAAAEHEDLQDCIERLSGSQQQSIALAFFEGLTHEQLARRLASPMGTIKSRIRRGLARLRECLDP